MLFPQTITVHFKDNLQAAQLERPFLVISTKSQFIRRAVQKILLEFSNFSAASVHVSTSVQPVHVDKSRTVAHGKVTTPQ
jgi:DNA repair photolyase